jgi:hypothetical protein
MDKIEELKKLLWILDSKHNVSVSQTKENIDYIADEIVKLFCQPAVISLFCHHNGTYTTVTDSNGNEVCCKCRKPLAK